MENSLPEEIAPGNQLNLKITNVQTPPKNNQGEQAVQTDNKILPNLDVEEAPPVTKPNSTVLTNTPPVLTPDLPEAEIPLPQTTLPQQALEPSQTPVSPTDNKQAPNNLQQLVQNFSASFKALPNGNIGMNAIVIDTKSTGELLVDTRIGKVIINAGPQFANVDKGSTLNLELTGITQSAPEETTLPNNQLPVQQLMKSWPNLQNVADYLNPAINNSSLNNNAGISSDTASRMAAAMNPGGKIDSRDKTAAGGSDDFANIDGDMSSMLLGKLAGIDGDFAARIAAFLNAVKSGNIRDWLGANNYDALLDSDTGSNLLKKLSSDIDNMRNLMAERGNEWQSMLFPIYDGRELNQARMHIKYLPDQNNQPDKRAGTRFVVELSTGYFGEIQMDGLVHNNVGGKYFDMIIRTQTPFDYEIENDIRQIFSDAGAITGFKGDIEFATMRQFPLQIMNQVINNQLNQRSASIHKGIEV